MSNLINVIDHCGRSFWQKKELFRSTGMLTWKKVGKFFTPFCTSEQLEFVDLIYENFKNPGRKQAPEFQGVPTYTELGKDQGSIVESVLRRESVSAEAVPGSGKSFTLAVLNSLLPSNLNVLNLTFSVDSKHDLMKKVDSSLPTRNVMNFHGMALSYMARILGGKPNIDARGGKFFKFFADNPYETNEDVEKITNEKAVRNLCGMVMNTCTDYNNPNELQKLADYYINQICFFKFVGFLDWDYVLSKTPQCMEYLHKTAFSGKRDLTFDEMIYYFAMSNVEMPRYDVVFVDECQDVNKAQIKMIEKISGKQVVAVGDNFQSIYGFRGADEHAISNLQKAFDLKNLPLHETRRLPQCVAENLNKNYNRTIKSSKEGGQVIYSNDFKSEDFGEGDMVLGRRRADALDACLSLNCSGVEAAMIGDDLVATLLDVMRHTKEGSQTNQETGKRESVPAEFNPANIASRLGDSDPNNPDDDKTTLTKRILNECDDLKDYICRIKDITTITPDKAKCGTCHSSKGLEAERVHLFIPKTGFSPQIPMQPWEQVGERNLKFVAESRSLDTLNIINFSGA